MRPVAPRTYNKHEPEQSAYILFARGSRFLSEGHPHQAAMLLSQAKLMEPEKGSIREALGRALFQAGRVARAIGRGPGRNSGQRTRIRVRRATTSPGPRLEWR